MIRAVFKDGYNTTTAYGLYQYDRGQTLRIEGLELPETVEVHFSIRPAGGDAPRRLGTMRDGALEVEIPNVLLENEGARVDYDIYAFVYLTDVDSGETVKCIKMEVTARPKPADWLPPDEPDFGQQLIASVAAEREAAKGYADTAEAAKDAAEQHSDNAAKHAQAAQTAKEAAERARDSAEKLAEAFDGHVVDETAKAVQTVTDKAAEYTASVDADIKAIQAAGTTQKQAVETAGDKQVADVNAAGTEQMDAVNTAGTTQIEAVNAAGAAQTEAVNAAGAAQIDTIRRIAADIAPAIKCTARGTDITIRDATDAPLSEMRVYGRTVQETTTGKNLFDASVIGEQTRNGVTFKSLGDGKISIKGATTTSLGETQIIPLSLPAGVYSVSLNPDVRLESSSAAVFMLSYEHNGTRVWKRDIAEIAEGDTNQYAYISINRNVTIDVIACPQIELGETATTPEPYTGGKPSPSPDYPQEMVSVGDNGSVATTITDGTNTPQSLPHTTPNGIRGIPVSSGGNYTDANGQQWIADYRDWGRGVDVQMTTKRTYNGTEVWSYNTGSGAFLLGIVDVNYDVVPICDKYPCASGISNIGNEQLRISGGIKGIMIRNDAFGSDVSAWKENLSQNPITVLFALKNPIETPIPEDELAAYRALHTNRPNTSITNDAGAHMEVVYTADTEAYINNNYVPKASYEALEARVAALEQHAISL